MQRPKQLHIKLSDSPKRINLLNMPLRINSLSQDSQIPLMSNLPEATNQNDLTPKKYRRSRSISSHHSKFSDLGVPSQHEKGRALMNQFLNGLVTQLKKVGRETEKQEVDRMMKAVDAILDFQDYVTQYFTCYNRCFKMLIGHQENTDSINLPLDFKLRKKILFAKEGTSPEKPSKKTSIQAIVKQNEQLKKQVFRLRQTSSLLQKRILLLITQYKQRKRTYMTEIQRLTTIINTTIVGIPQLLLQNRQKQERQSSTNKMALPNDLLSLTHKQSDYNTISNVNDPLSIGLQYTYKALNTTDRSGLKRFRSQDSFRQSI